VDLSSNRYEPDKIDLSNPNVVYTIEASLVGKNKKVLEVGCSTGYFTKILKDFGNEVYCIEIDREAAKLAEKHCNSIVIGDIEDLNLEYHFKEKFFDVVLFGDVLEHLKDPERVLRKIKGFLKDDGYVVASIPNIAHGDVILNLMAGKFDYRPLGLLDKTHLRFFTLRSIKEMFERCGFKIAEIYTTKVEVGYTELGEVVKSFPAPIVNFIKKLPYSNVYQFVVKAYHAESSIKEAELPEPSYSSIQIEEIAELQRKIFELEKELILRYQEIDNLKNVLSSVKEEKQKIESYVQKLEGELSKIKAELEIGNRERELETLKMEIEKKEEAIKTKDDEIEKLKNNLALKDEEIRRMNEEILRLSSELHSIKSSFTWRALMKWHAFVERIAPLGTRRRKWYDLGIIGLRTIANEGFKSFWRKYKLYKNYKKFPKKVRKAEDIKIELPEDLPELDVKVSVIIPTKNAGKDFDFTLEKIRNQKGLRELEIIVVDSGSQDETTEIALKHGAKIVSIRPEDYSHSKARNLGAKKAKGEYLVFMTQDAIPAGEYLFYTMLKVIGSENNIAAVTCRQIPRSDADSFACFILWNYYRTLELDEDKILYGGKDFEKLPYLEKRKRCQLDSVCFMIKKDVFEKFRFNEDLDYAEDLELGLRLIKNGYKIAFLASSAVIHSHNRPPIYFLKRAFVDTTTLQKIFKDNAIEVGYFPQCSIQDLLNSLIIVNKAINLSLNKFSKLYEPGSFEAHDLLHLLLIEIKKELEKDVNFCKLLSIGSNDPLEEFLIRSLDLEITNSKLEDTKIINEIFLNFENAIALYETFLKEAKLIYGYQEFSETIRKIFATVAGSILACALLWGKKSTLAEKLESSLKVGI